jgi:uncharacterized protein YndB with AHSA1/START domain
MTDLARFKPGTVYVTYIAATPERVWQALIDPSFTRQYFFGLTIRMAAFTSPARFWNGRPRAGCA